MLFSIAAKSYKEATEKAELLLDDSEIEDKFAQLQDKGQRKNRAVKIISSDDSDEDELSQTPSKKSAPTFRIPFLKSSSPKISMLSE